MPNTAPDVTAAATFVRVHFKYIDANGQLGSDSYVTTVAAATNANVNAVAEAIGAASNANLYEVSIEPVWAAFPVAATAVEEPRESVKDNIVTLWRDNATRNTQDAYIPAPLDSLFLVGTNDVDPTQTEYLAVELAFNNLLPAAYGAISVRFSEHKGVNKKIRR